MQKGEEVWRIKFPFWCKDWQGAALPEGEAVLAEGNDSWFIWPPRIFQSLVLDLDQDKTLWSECWKLERIWTVINILQLAPSAYEWAPLENLAPTIKWFRDLIARQKGIASSYFCGNQGNFRSWIQMMEHMEIRDPDSGFQWALHGNNKQNPKSRGGEQLTHKNGGRLSWWSPILARWETATGWESWVSYGSAGQILVWMGKSNTGRREEEGLGVFWCQVLRSNPPVWVRGEGEQQACSALPVVGYLATLSLCWFSSLYSCVTRQGAEGAEGCVGAEWLLPGAQMVGEQATLSSHTFFFFFFSSPFCFQTAVLNRE